MNGLDSTATMVGGVLSWGAWRHPRLSASWNPEQNRAEDGKGGAVCAQHRGYPRKGKVVSLQGEGGGKKVRVVGSGI